MRIKGVLNENFSSPIQWLAINCKNKRKDKLISFANELLRRKKSKVSIKIVDRPTWSMNYPCKA